MTEERIISNIMRRASNTSIIVSLETYDPYRVEMESYTMHYPTFRTFYNFLSPLQEGQSKAFIIKEYDNRNCYLKCCWNLSVQETYFGRMVHIFRTGKHSGKMHHCCSFLFTENEKTLPGKSKPVKTLSVSIRAHDDDIMTVPGGCPLIHSKRRWWEGIMYGREIRDLLFDLLFRNMIRHNVKSGGGISLHANDEIEN